MFIHSVPLFILNYINFIPRRISLVSDVKLKPWRTIFHWLSSVHKQTTLSLTDLAIFWMPKGHIISLSYTLSLL